MARGRVHSSWKLLMRGDKVMKGGLVFCSGSRSLQSPSPSLHPSTLAISSAISPALVGNPQDQIPSWAANKRLFVFLLIAIQLSTWCGSEYKSLTRTGDDGVEVRDSVLSLTLGLQHTPHTQRTRARTYATDTVKRKRTRWPSDWGVLAVRQMGRPSVLAHRQQPHSSSTLLLVLCPLSVCVCTHKNMTAFLGRGPYVLTLYIKVLVKSSYKMFIVIIISGKHS